MKRVLIVDDVPEIRRLVRLAIGNHDVHECASAEEALNLLFKLGGVDLIILDVMLVHPRDGLALLAAVRNHRAWVHTRVVMLTGRDSPDDRKKAQSLGANAYFTKPFSPNELSDCVERLLRDGTPPTLAEAAQH